MDVHLLLPGPRGTQKTKTMPELPRANVQEIDETKETKTMLQLGRVNMKVKNLLGTIVIGNLQEGIEMIERGKECVDSLAGGLPDDENQVRDLLCDNIQTLTEEVAAISKVKYEESQRDEYIAIINACLKKEMTEYTDIDHVRAVLQKTMDRRDSDICTNTSDQLIKLLQHLMSKCTANTRIEAVVLVLHFVKCCVDRTANGSFEHDSGPLGEKYTSLEFMEKFCNWLKSEILPYEKEYNDIVCRAYEITRSVDKLLENRLFKDKEEHVWKTLYRLSGEIYDETVKLR